MILAVLKGLIMSDDAPTPEQTVPSLLHAVMWACMFGGVDAVIASKPWPIWAGAFTLSLVSHIVGIKWPQIKPVIGPRFASLLERLASDRRYRRAIYSLIATAAVLTLGVRIYRHYYHEAPTMVGPSAPDSPAPTQPYLVAAENSFPEGVIGPLDKSPIWETTNLVNNGKAAVPIRSPISCLVYFRIVNLQTNAVVISQLSIEVMTSQGWKAVAYWDQGPIYWVGYPNIDFHKATEMRMPMLDIVIRGRAIRPKETVKGWLAICYPRMNALVSSRRFRVNIAGTTGESITVESGNVPIGNFTDSSFRVGDRHDISRYKTVFIQDMPEYWRNITPQ